MSRRFHSLKEGDTLSKKLKEISKRVLITHQVVFIPELRLTVYSNAAETPEETRKRYLEKTLSHKIKEKETDV